MNKFLALTEEKRLTILNAALQCFALSHILGTMDIKNYINLSADSLEVRQYLNGQTLNVEGNKGWNLVCVDSYGLGFGKLSGGILKNHYPKGLRSLHL